MQGEGKGQEKKMKHGREKTLPKKPPLKKRKAMATDIKSKAVQRRSDKQPVGRPVPRTKKDEERSDLCNNENAFYLKLLMVSPTRTHPQLKTRKVPDRTNMRVPNKTRSRKHVVLGDECRVLTYDDDDSVEIARDHAPIHNRV
ncbi:hypothetical protein DYB37_011692 [Aphanomyces astaci]|uniref:Uncharacterized protein n=1 Tax=Aphanomyces astaci TaxID=112090 RepID=A0A418D7J9_APHAT|nr:hypothetical protein DYB35_009278 [Aphanomyces astaci]RHZ30133.1 hypothetical protein DYB37_011692 [Aphanomyces astaci]